MKVKDTMHKLEIQTLNLTVVLNNTKKELAEERQAKFERELVIIGVKACNNFKCYKTEINN